MQEKALNRKECEQKDLWNPEICTHILRVQQDVNKSPKIVAVLDGMALEVLSLRSERLNS